VANYKLTPEALSDLEDIWNYTAENWGVDQAVTYIDGLNSTFMLLADSPEMSRVRTELSPPVHIHTHEKHMIVYLTKSTHSYNC